VKKKRVVKKKKAVARITARGVLARIDSRLKAIEDAVRVIEERQMTTARTLVPLTFDLRRGGWCLPPDAGPYDMTDMVREHDE